MRRPSRPPAPPERQACGAPKPAIRPRRANSTRRSRQQRVTVTSMTPCCIVTREAFFIMYSSLYLLSPLCTSSTAPERLACAVAPRRRAAGNGRRLGLALSHALSRVADPSQVASQRAAPRTAGHAMGCLGCPRSTGPGPGPGLAWPGGLVLRTGFAGARLAWWNAPETPWPFLERATDRRPTASLTASLTACCVSTLSQLSHGPTRGASNATVIECVRIQADRPGCVDYG
ncbi:hypothetical protein F4802DRAFT_234159 [Xylaria palmicola]|nr:hypothetical protein F4802DRAFT_234159 [Xylaria palmicola]